MSIDLCLISSFNQHNAVSSMSIDLCLICSLYQHNTLKSIAVDLCLICSLNQHNAVSSMSTDLCLISSLNQHNALSSRSIDLGLSCLLNQQNAFSSTFILIFVSVSVFSPHQYNATGYYEVSMTASNAFGSMSTSLCPTVVVDSSQYTSFNCPPPTVRLASPYGNTSLSEPAFNKRSLETRVRVLATAHCPENITRMDYSWKVHCSRFSYLPYCLLFHSLF